MSRMRQAISQGILRTSEETESSYDRLMDAIRRNDPTAIELENRTLRYWSRNTAALQDDLNSLR